MLAACSDPYPMTAPVRGIGDAIDHCRQYSRHMLPQEAVISLDSLSTRESKHFYDVFFSVQDSNDSGYVRCQIDKKGTIVYFNIRDYRRKGRSFVDF